MTVYVDALRNYPSFGRACHMIADTPEELHAMAVRIGLKRKWFQGDHYDLMPGKRQLAVRAGAVEASSREIVDVRRRQRAVRKEGQA